MDPQTPTPNFQQPLTPEQPPKKGWPLSKKATKLIIYIVLAIIVFGVVYLLTNKKSEDKKTTDTSDSSIYYNREGYNPEDYQPKIGDPMALKLDKTADAIKTESGAAIVSACNVLTISDLQKEKLYIGTHSAPNSIVRTYFDGIGKAPHDKTKYSLPQDGSAEQCHYIFENQSDVDLTVYQPPMNDLPVIEEEIAERYSAYNVSDLDGAQAYKRNNSSGSRVVYMLKRGEVAVRFSTTIKDQAVVDTLFRTASKNLASLATTPKGPPTTEYSSPTFSKSIAKACDLISNDDLKAITGNDAGPLVQEGLAPSIGVTQVNGKLRNFIQNRCERRNSGLGSSLGGSSTFDQELDVVTTSFQESDGAAYQVGDMTKGQENLTTINGVGDEAYAYKDTAGQNTVIFRQGRFVVEVVLNRTSQQGGLENTKNMADKLTPYAKSTVEKLKKL